MQFSLKSSLCRFIRKSFVGIFKMNTDSCFRHPRDGTSCHRTLEDLASWTRRPRFSGRRPQDCNCCRVTQYRRVGVLHQVTQGFCSPPQLLSPLLSDSPPQLATPSFFLGNAFLSKNTILSSSLSNTTFLSVFLSTILRAFSVERFLSALLSTFLSAFFVEHFFECFFEHYKHNSRYFGTLLKLILYCNKTLLSFVTLLE